MEDIKNLTMDNWKNTNISNTHHKNGYELPCKNDDCKILVAKSVGSEEVEKHCKKKISSKRRKHKIIIIGGSYGRACAYRVKYDSG
jgi:hypothetical protein